MEKVKKSKSFTLKKRLGLSVGIMSLLFLGLFYIGFLTARSSNQRVRDVYEQTNAKTIAAVALENAFTKSLVTLVDQLALEVYPWDVAPDRLAEIQGIIHDNLDFLHKTPLDDDEKALAEDIFSKVDKANDFLAKFGKTVDHKDLAALRALRPDLYPAVQPIGYSVQEFLDYELGKSKNLLQKSDRTFQNSYRAILGLSVLLVLLIGGAALWFMNRQVIRPIEILSAVTERIVREGDLTQKIEIRSQDEVGRLASNFSLMVEKLREIPLGLQASVQKLSHALSGLEKAADEQNKSVTAQAASLQETQVTAQEIKQTSQMAAQKATDILRMAEKADEIGRTGEESVELSLKGLMDIRQQVQEIAAKIGDLTDRTRQVGSITDTVKDLADQSNMLALNAAIEAVRSGEHGKGFGLVAREIRRLADQSLQSTGRVKEILDNISEAIDKVVQINESGSARMESGLVQVKNSGENLRALVNVIKENSDSVKQIANAVNQQNIGISQVFIAVKDQNGMMEETVKRLETTTEAVKVLQEVAKSVSDIVGSYKV